MRVTATVFALLLTMPGLAGAQAWEEFNFIQDGFAINFPGKPRITETTWDSQLRYKLPARVYNAERDGGRERFSVTVVDYSSLEQQGTARWKQCPPGNSQCRDGGETIGPGYWKQDERGAIVYAINQYIRKPEYKVTYYAWDWQDMVEGHSLQLDGQDGRRTLVYVAMHERKLYVIEGSVPHGQPEPGLFQQSLGWLDKDGKRIRYTETVYSNSYHGLGVYPKPAYRISND